MNKYSNNVDTDITLPIITNYFLNRSSRVNACQLDLCFDEWRSLENHEYFSVNHPKTFIILMVDGRVSGSNMLSKETKGVFYCLVLRFACFDHFCFIVCHFCGGYLIHDGDWISFMKILKSHQMHTLQYRWISGGCGVYRSLYNVTAPFIDGNGGTSPFLTINVFVWVHVHCVF